MYFLCQGICAEIFYFQILNQLLTFSLENNCLRTIRGSMETVTLTNFFLIINYAYFFTTAPNKRSAILKLILTARATWRTCNTGACKLMTSRLIKQDFNLTGEIRTHVYICLKLLKYHPDRLRVPQF